MAENTPSGLAVWTNSLAQTFPFRETRRSLSSLIHLLQFNRQQREHIIAFLSRFIITKLVTLHSHFYSTTNLQIACCKMAQGAVASIALPANGVGSSSAPLTAEELREMLEYDRICQFRDQVLAGTHPRVTIPAHLLRKPINSATDSAPLNISTTHSASIAQHARSISNTQNDDHSNSFRQKSPTAPRFAPGASKSEINPILLEKSDDLIKAEIQLQRQRLERALRDQIEQQRIATKALLQTSESLPNFDLSEVLSKALAIVHPTVTAEVEPSVGARSSASDSFDERTFYSSQHDTPDASSSSQGQKESSELQSLPALSRNEHRSAGSAHNQVGEGDAVMTDASRFINNNIAAHGVNSSVAIGSRPLSTLSAIEHQNQLSASSTSSDSRGGAYGGTSGMNKEGQAASKSKSHIFTSPRQMDSRAVVQRTNQELLTRAFDDSRASPLIRAHNLSPLAPQPARVSPLATARDPPVLRDHNEELPPAQVSALRHVASGLSSTDSSPKNSKSKKKKKEKKRKTKGAASPDSPYIKPEPLSPEPFAAAPLPRPQKRQRQSGQFSAGLSYDEPQEIHSRPEPQREARIIREPQRYEDGYEVERPRAEPVYQRVEREDEDYRRVSGPQYIRRAQSPVYAIPYQPETRLIRAASHANLDRRVAEEPRYYRDQFSRASVRPDLDRERSRSPIMKERRSPLPMPPPRKPIRIVMDEYGNEYIDPTPIASARQSMAPPVRYREQEIVYERAPMRAVSARIPVETYEDGGVIYERAPPVARRVITQPEYLPAPSDHRVYRQREYSVHPAGDEFTQVRAPERRPVYEESNREYSRAASVRPEPIRYEIPREYAGRLQSVRPEGVPREYTASVHPEGRREIIPQREYSVRPEPIPREYAASVHPEMRREMAPPGQREYSARPMETAPRRQYLPVQEGERYYEEIPPRRPAEIAFIERPRAREASVVVYADDRREVYR